MQEQNEEMQEQNEEFMREIYNNSSFRDSLAKFEELNSSLGTTSSASYATDLLTHLKNLYQTVARFLTAREQHSQENMFRIFSDLISKGTISLPPSLIQAFKEVVGEIDNTVDKYKEPLPDRLKKEMSEEDAKIATENLDNLIEQEARLICDVIHLCSEIIEQPEAGEVSFAEDAKTALEIVLNRAIESELTTQKYHALFRHDQELTGLLLIIKEIITRFTLSKEDYDYVTEFLKSTSHLQKVLLRHYEVVNGESAAVITKTILKETFLALRKLQLYLEDFPDKAAEELAVLGQAFVGLSKARNWEVADMIVKPITEVMQIPQEDRPKIGIGILNSARDAATDTEKGINWVIFALTDPTQYDKYRTNVAAYNGSLQEEVDVVTKEQRSDNLAKAEDIAVEQLRQMSQFPIEIRSRIHETTLEEIKRIKPKKAQSPAELKEEFIGNSDQYGIEDRIRKEADFKYQVSRFKHKLNQDEIILLGKAAGLDFDKIDSKPADNNPAKSHYEAAEDQIVSEKRDWESADRGHWVHKYSPRSTAHFDAARTYIEYHREKDKMSKSPELRLSAETQEPGKHRSHPDFKKGKQFRTEFAGLVKKLPWFSNDHEKAIKELNPILLEKKETASKLKPCATLLRGGDNKVERNQKTYYSLIPDTKKQRKGYFFPPAQQLIAYSSETMLDCPHFDLFNQGEILRDLGEQIDDYRSTVNGELVDAGIVVEHEKGDLTPLTVEELAAELSKIYTLITDEDGLDTFQEIAKRLMTLQQSHSQLKEDLLEERKCLDLSSLIALTHKQTIVDTADLVEHSQFSKFNPKDSHALNQVGQMVKNVKQATSNLKVSCWYYNRSLTASLQAYEEAHCILKQIKEGATLRNVSALIETAISDIHTINKVHDIKLDDIIQFSPKYLSYLKLKDMATLLTETLSAIPIDAEEPELARFLGAKEEELKASIEELSNRREKTNTTTKELVEIAAETVRGITYMADHTTTGLSGTRL